jgi:DNA-binding response OmpR family regulator
MNGKEAFLAMKNVNQDIVVLLASGYSLNGEAQSILNMGANEFIQKPFDIDELRKKITSLIGKCA